LLKNVACTADPYIILRDRTGEVDVLGTVEYISKRNRKKAEGETSG